MYLHLNLTIIFVCFFLIGENCLHRIPYLTKCCRRSQFWHDGIWKGIFPSTDIVPWHLQWTTTSGDGHKKGLAGSCNRPGRAMFKSLCWSCTYALYEPSACCSCFCPHCVASVKNDLGQHVLSQVTQMEILSWYEVHYGYQMLSVAISECYAKPLMMPVSVCTCLHS